MRRLVVPAALAVLLGLALTGPGAMGASAAPSQQDLAVREAVSALPDYITRVMRRMGVPGVAVAVVHRDRLIYAEGFGVRDVDSGAKVTPDTVFQLASVSKPLGASAVAAAVGRGDLAWDTPAAPLLPGFGLSDAWVSEHVTVGDLYAHRSGLPGNYGNDLENFGYGRQHIFEKAHLEPLSPFRITYDYSNFGLTAGGIAAANAAGVSWDQLTRDAIFAPLGMSRSTYDYDELAQMDNVATLHQQSRGRRWKTGPVRNAEAQAPAGSANSSVKDMARWMRMMLAGGTFEGKRIVEQDALDTMLTLQIRNSLDPTGAIAGYGYGMGVVMEQDAPLNWTHSGAFSSGASTRILLVPEWDLGIVVLTNGWPVGVPEAVTATFQDLVRFGEPTRDWLKVTSARFAAYNTPSYSIDGQKRPANPSPARPLAAYAGTYANDYVGVGDVSVDGDRLVLAVGPGGMTRLSLRHWDGDVFFYNEIDMPPGFFTAVRFSGQDDAGSATSMTIAEVGVDLGTLSRRAR